MNPPPPSQPYQLRGHIVAPRGIDEIRAAATNARAVLGLSDVPVSLPHFLEGLVSFGITVDVIDDEDDLLMLVGVEAACIPEKATIMLTPETYDRACRNDPRTRFTIFHELGHIVLQHAKVLPRASIVAKRYIDSEWQADQFAAEATMPLEGIAKLATLTPTAVAQAFGVSFLPARRRISQLKKTGAIQ